MNSETFVDMRRRLDQYVSGEKICHDAPDIIMDGIDKCRKSMTEISPTHNSEEFRETVHLWQMLLAHLRELESKVKRRWYHLFYSKEKELIWMNLCSAIALVELQLFALNAIACHEVADFINEAD